MINKLTQFEFERKMQTINYCETMQVKQGVSCEVYTFVNRHDCDLGIIRVDIGESTPHQKVIEGYKTIEGFLSGAGELHILRSTGGLEIYKFPNKDSNEVIVNIGDSMQWSADRNKDLVCFEICFPPYQEGRFQEVESAITA